ncbi:MAG: MoxR family ATPase [Cyclobacteriaceae bacterium]|nr:MoxR family ATPase [Cyclobacteriaceae bacterium]
MEDNETYQNRIDLSPLKEGIETIKREVGKIIIGQEKMVDLIIAAILTDGHILIEGVPGVAKTLTSRIIARLIKADFSRIQFTPDLMPSDILGTSVYNMKNSEFEFKKGPLFSNIILIDEINRAPAKTQAALFEVMEERQITIEGHTYPMSAPYMVLATQNPIDQEGTYRLPEAQLDRFMFKVSVKYPGLEDEINILKLHHEGTIAATFDALDSVMVKEKINEYRNLVSQILVEEPLLRYIATLVSETRTDESLYLGGSPRASLAILKGSKALAAMRGRDFVTPDDIQAIIYPALRHRIILTPEREMEGISPDEIIRQIIKRTEVPR